MVYNILSLLAPVFVPIAPVIFFGWKVYTAVQEMTQSPWLSIPAGALTALGLEAVGILAGHVGMVAWRRGDNRTAVIAAVIMAAYVGIGTIELWGSVGAVVFWIAPLVYVLVALQELLRQDASADVDDRNFQKQLKILAVHNKQELALAKVSQNVRSGSQSARSMATSGDSQEKVYTCPCGWSTSRGSRSYNAHKRYCKVTEETAS